MVRREADARSRGGYMAAISAEARLALRDAIGTGPVLPTRLLRRSPLIDVWFGVTRADATRGRVVVTWEPGFRPVGTGRTGAARVTLKATTRDGHVLFEGVLAPMRVGGVADAMSPDRAEFDAPAGRVQIDMTILGIAGEKLDVDARDLDVPAMNGAMPLLLPAILISTQSAREFREVTADANAAPDPSRQFRRTERLVIRVPAYASGSPVRVTGRLLNRLAQPMRDLDVASGLPAASRSSICRSRPSPPATTTCSSACRGRQARSISAWVSASRGSARRACRTEASAKAGGATGAYGTTTTRTLMRSEPLLNTIR